MVGLLLSKKCVSFWKRHADIQLSNGDFYTKGGELLEIFFESAGDLSDD